ncbi:hypothetical protein [Noviherbaspirillum sp. ST9]|uniref:hypothetical protein n=1 Tax=Noviherbaspirillum sp. ST9 TaxID=3401606 RepID=UPI003B587120
MKTSLPLKIFLGAALVFGGLYVAMKKQTPPWTGPFIGKRVVIQKETDPSLSTSWVFADVDDFKKMFMLQKGDECFVMTEPEWRWQDAKGGFTLVPVFCPAKGGGWTDQHILDGA